MAAEDWNDSEASYRRGYEHGAFEFYESLTRKGILVPCELEKWLHEDVAMWRHDTDGERDIPPPDAP